jgi:hypothetical protein
VTVLGLQDNSSMLRESKSLMSLNCAVAEVEVDDLDDDLNLVSLLDLAAGTVLLNVSFFKLSVLEEITSFIRNINA